MGPVRLTWKRVIQQRLFPSRINLRRKFQKPALSAMLEKKNETILDAVNTGETISVVPIVTRHIF
jgi:hypothetical protein